MIDFFDSFLSLIKFINTPKNKKKYVFFSESEFYKNHFQDLIENLLEIGEKDKFYICTNKNEYLFFKEKINTVYINNRFFLLVIFNSMSCKNFIMTVTGLGKVLNKSNKCDRYIYFFHALASSHKIYTKEAFKNFDVIFSNGKYQTEELEVAEKKFLFPKKKIINIGYFYLDYLRRNVNLKLKQNKCILFAPSWSYNKKNLFNDYAFEIAKILIENNYTLILRPHSEHFIRSAKIINKIKDLKSSKFILDTNKSNIDSMQKSSILITDNSSIIGEYYLSFKRPILKIDYIDKIHNEDFKELNIETFDEMLIKKVGQSVSINKLNDLPDIINKSLLLKTDDETLNQIILDNISNIGNSAKVAAKILKDESF